MAANFSAILLSEPEKEEMLKILCGVKGHFEDYYGLRIPDSPVRRHLHPRAALHPHPRLPRQGHRAARYLLLQGGAEKSPGPRLPTHPSEHQRHLQAAHRDRPPRPAGALPRHARLICRAAAVNQASALEEISRIIKLAKLETTVNALEARGHLPVPGADRGRQELRRRPHRRVPVRQPREAARHRPGGLQEGRGRREAGQRRRRGRRRRRWCARSRTIPFSVILFENIEEAHSSVLYFLGKTLTKGEVVDDLGKKHYPGQHHLHPQPDRHRRGEKGIGHRLRQGRSAAPASSSSLPRS